MENGINAAHNLAIAIFHPTILHKINVRWKYGKWNMWRSTQ
ncbi:hypothetical protein SAMN04488023_116115 [Pedobacter rhizosphaerae]|uniref:Uncharacterized protein n=1 Tax=Pedobacter rhizosphaerae TaxID=390241 RepID=A0A1H9S3G2_9SPHI|nr:hypothetical protein SAMN04488023_116115 [Pedobacter rhizosphaerae]